MTCRKGSTKLPVESCYKRKENLLREEPRWQSRRTCSHSLLREHQNHNYLLDSHRQEDTGTHQKTYPTSKAKEKPQWDGRRGWITVKSNPITAGWVTDRLENTYTTEVHPLEWRFWAPRQVPNLGGWQREEEFLENQTLKPSGNWLQGFDRTGGNWDSTLGGHTQSSVRIGTQRKEQWPQGRLNQTYLLVLGGLLQRQGVAVAHRGDKDTGSRSSGKYSLAWALPESAISPSKEPR